MSALPLDRMPKAIEECFAVLKPGGMLLFRDYGNSEMRLRGNFELLLAEIIISFTLLFAMRQVFMI